MRRLSTKPYLLRSDLFIAAEPTSSLRERIEANLEIMHMYEVRLGSSLAVFGCTNTCVGLYSRCDYLWEDYHLRVFPPV